MNLNMEKVRPIKYDILLLLLLFSSLIVAKLTIGYASFVPTTAVNIQGKHSKQPTFHPSRQHVSCFVSPLVKNSSCLVFTTRDFFFLKHQ